MGGGGHHPPVPEPSYAKLLANKSGLCPPDFHYPKDPKHWRRNTAVVVGGLMLVFYSAFRWSNENEVRYRAPKGWIPSLMWNDKIMDPVDYRGRTLDRVTGKPKDGSEAATHH
ncbi:predicted protein [Haematococcus lacustris]|uniref:Uncharacterized protein n=2 Tax=Haematococcus lacustris TaxID=44745 RepID=A0A699YSF4_HAELA|nr:predicted protein [Haematococcus lacustris]